MPFLDKLDRMLPGGKKRAADDKARDERIERMDNLASKIENSKMYKDYMGDVIRHSIEFSDEHDMISSILYSAINNEDVDAIQQLAKLLKGDFDLKNAVEDIKDKKIYELVVSLHRDAEQWKQDTNMKRDDEFSESVSIIIDGANRYL